MQETKSVKRHHDVLWIMGIIVMALVVLAPQINYHALAVGEDWEFQWNRFYEAAMQIKNNRFNFFQSIYSFRQSGRIVNAVYGSTFAYFNGIILIVVRTWFRAQIISSFLCLFTAGSGMYFWLAIVGLNDNWRLLQQFFIWVRHWLCSMLRIQH